MERISESILIESPRERVFGFIRGVEPRLRLCPTYSILRFEKLTEGETGVGARFHIVMLSGGVESEYESEVIEFQENAKIVTQDTEGRLRVEITLEETPGGTLYSHTEEFIIPEGALYALTGEARPWWLGMLEIFAWPWSVDIERKKKKTGDILEGLRAELRVFLGRIKERLEGE